MDAIADLLVCIADTVVHMNGKNSGSAKNVNTRIDKVVKSVAELKASLEYSQQDIDDLKEAADAIDKMEEELDDIQTGLHKQEEKLVYLENQSRRNNVASMEFPNNTTRPG